MVFNHMLNLLLRHCNNEIKNLLYYVIKSNATLCVVGSNEEDRFEFIKSLAYEVEHSDFYCSTKEMCNSIKCEDYIMWSMYVDYKKPVHQCYGSDGVIEFAMGTRIITEVNSDIEFKNIDTFIHSRTSTLVSYSGSIDEYIERYNSIRLIAKEDNDIDRYQYIVSIKREDGKLIIDDIYMYLYKVNLSECSLISLSDSLLSENAIYDIRENISYRHLFCDLGLGDRIRLISFLEELN